MASDRNLDPEIESFNLAALDVSALDTRLELTTVLPQYIICDGNCSTNCSCHDVGGCYVHCGSNSGCACDAL